MFTILEKEINSYRNKIIFGASNYGVVWEKILKDNGIETSYFSDNDDKKQGEFLNDKEILTLKKLYKLNKNNTIIMIASTIGYLDIY